MELLTAETMKGLVNVATNIRSNILKMTANAGTGHPGGSLSIVEILTALYFEVMQLDPLDPSWEDRDRFVLSKGHASTALYATLAEKGFLPHDELLTFDCIDSRLQGHVDMRRTPGVDMSTGSLGQGLSAAVGMAIGAKLSNKTFRVYSLLGDGELQEGQVWEAAMLAGNRRLDNLVAIIDYNKLQLLGPISTIMPIEPLIDKWRAFNWTAIEVDGHNIEQIIDALQRAASLRNKPTVIVCHTVKGKGVSFMEHQPSWHSRGITQEELKKALEEIEIESHRGEFQ